MWYRLPPAGSRLLWLPRARCEPAEAPRKGLSNLFRPLGEPTVRRVGPNVLTLDYVDVTAGGETKKNFNVIKASHFVFQKHGLERSPWDRAVQFHDELINKTFPAGSGYEATYRFTITEKVPASLAIVIERADLHTVTCNGNPISTATDEWWLDKAFGKLDISSAARVGENEVTIKASPLTIYHELEAAFVIGAFSLEPAEKGFVIAPDRELKPGPWNEQGAPLYGGGVVYGQRFDLDGKSGRYWVVLTGWRGSVAKVRVNGQPAGAIWHQPWACDVTDLIQPGENEIEVEVIGTLKNTLGPHHGNPGLGSAWPSMWDNAPEQGPPAGKAYSTVGYGLLGPFDLFRHERSGAN